MMLQVSYLLCSTFLGCILIYSRRVRKRFTSCLTSNILGYILDPVVLSLPCDDVMYTDLFILPYCWDILVILTELAGVHLRPGGVHSCRVMVAMTCQFLAHDMLESSR